MRYRIVCTIQEPAGVAPVHAHIVSVGTGAEADKATMRWSLAETLAAMDRGDEFYTLGEASGKTALVTSYTCGSCRSRHIRSGPDAVADNNLDNLRICRWTS